MALCQKEKEKEMNPYRILGFDKWIICGDNLDIRELDTKCSIVSMAIRLAPFEQRITVGKRTHSGKPGGLSEKGGRATRREELERSTYDSANATEAVDSDL